VVELLCATRNVRRYACLCMRTARKPPPVRLQLPLVEIVRSAGLKGREVLDMAEKDDVDREVGPVVRRERGNEGERTQKR
jgi:hypothetical protein